MKFLQKYIGIALIVVGSLMLILLQVCHFTFVNALLLLPLGFIIAGVVIHVWMIKRESRY